jgi:putrescine transport system substrate-binding protein
MDPDAKDQESIDKAKAHLLEVRPNVRKFHSSEYINALANGDICLAVGWSGDILQARDRAAEADAGVTVEYIIPKEGALMWFDNMAIPSDAANVEEAHEFLNYIMKPEVMAKASNYVYYANGNAASKEFLEEAVIGDPAIYPMRDTVAALHGVAGQRARETAAQPRLDRGQVRSVTSMTPALSAGLFSFARVGRSCHHSEASVGRLRHGKIPAPSPISRFRT